MAYRQNHQVVYDSPSEAQDLCKGRGDELPGIVSRPLVTIIIPAFNAAATIDATLLSVRTQSHREIEILVIDDGSTDGTASIVEEHARSDSRVRMIRQPNSGVAVARNRGISESKGEFIAPIDADDLWKPTKIERQLEAMVAGGADVGLVYTWHAEIDDQDVVISTAHQPTVEGDALIPMLGWNIVGSGSNALMRKRAVIEAGGYDASLRANRSEGCEDMVLFVRIAEKHKFALVREHLTGYRRWQGGMSSNGLQMLRSQALANSKFRALYPQHARHIRRNYSAVCQYLFWQAVKTRDVQSAAILVSKLFVSAPFGALKVSKRVSLALLCSVLSRHTKKVFKTGVPPARVFTTAPPNSRSSAHEGFL